MSSFQNRPRSQQSQTSRVSADPNMAATAFSNKGYKTRVVYKNAKEEYDPTDKRSLYAASFGRSVRPMTPQSTQNGAIKATLADIMSMKRTSSVKAANSKKNIETEVPQSKQQNRKGQSNGGLTVETQAVKSPSNKTEAKSATCAPTQAMYDSQGLKDAMVKEFCDSPYVKIDNEADYYEVVKKLDTCGKCWATQQRYYTSPFKVNHKGPGQTLYQKDFVKHPLEAQGPVLKNDFYSTWNNNVPVDYGTTNKNDFKAWNVGAPKRETMNWRAATSDVPFAGSSNYRTDYANWGANLVAHEKAPQGKTVISELPFMGRTTYGEEFSMPTATSQLKPVDRDLWKKKEKSPITTGMPFLGESLNAATYKPFKVSSQPGFKPAEEYVPTKALPEHMRSLYSKDFASKSQDKCPAAAFMETNVHPKFRHLSP